MDYEKFLLAEHSHFSDSFWKNEELGDKRVNLFITIVTAVLAGIVALFTSEYNVNNPLSVQLYATIALTATFIFGLVTFVRILWRNKVTDEYLEVLKYLKNEMITRSSENLESYKPPLLEQEERWLFRGGLGDMVAVLNSIILTVILGIWYRELYVLIIFLILTFAVQMIFISTRKKSWFKRKQSQWFRAGAGAVIMNENGQVLAFERRDNPGSWQLPQGGMNKGEVPRDVVFREIKEETGITKGFLSFVTEDYRLLAYELPKAYRNKKVGSGQVHYWFLFRLEGTEDIIDLGVKNEFKSWKWMSIEELIAETIDFRKPVYKSLSEFVSLHLSRR